MKVVQSSFFRAISAIVVGVLLIKYREETVQWITISIGVFFLLSGVISCAAYLSACRQKNKPQIFDAQGHQLTGLKPTFPIVGVGSAVLGMALVVMPETFVQWLMYMLAIILILGAVSQFMALSSIRAYAHVGAYFWVMPSVVLLVGLLALFFPSAIASAPLFIIGWCMLLYGVVEMVNTLKIGAVRRAVQKAVSTEMDEKKTEKEMVAGHLEEPQE